MVSEEFLNRIRVLDRTSIDFPDSFEEIEGEDVAWWMTRTVEERLVGLEEVRRMAYGYTEAPRGLSRFPLEFE